MNYYDALELWSITKYIGLLGLTAPIAENTS
jgi:hypothetical protein